MLNRMQRLKRLDDMLRCHSGFTIMELMARLDVGERTIRKDLEFIQGPPYNAVLWNEYRGKERLYRYKDIDYSIPLFEKSEGFREKISEIINVIDPLSDIPQYSWLKSCLMSIEQNGTTSIANTMSFDNNAFLEGIEHIKILVDAITNKYPVKMVYKPFNMDKRTIYVHPYHLKQYNTRWFLIGRPNGFEVIHNYALDRIVSIAHLSKPYIETDIDFEEYFDDVIGVSVNSLPIETIELMVDKRRYPYVRTKPLHWSQKHLRERDTDDMVCITISVKPNNELYSTILSFGSDMVVVSPETVKQEMLKRVSTLMNLYK